MSNVSYMNYIGYMDRPKNCNEAIIKINKKLTGMCSCNQRNQRNQRNPHHLFGGLNASF